MVYKKYVKRNNRLFGPYYCESYRDKNGKVRTRFVSGPNKKDKLLNNINKKLDYLNCKKICLVFGIIFMIFLFYLIFIYLIFN